MSGLDLARLKEEVAGRTAGEWKCREVPSVPCGDPDDPSPYDSTPEWWEIDADGKSNIVQCCYIDGDDEPNARAIVALVNAADELIAAAEERDRLAGLLHGLHDAASEIVDGWSEGGCLVSPPCRACRWCIFERTVESVRAALKGKP